MQAYITKYALTAGIYTLEGYTSGDGDSMFVVPRHERYGMKQYFQGRDWHVTRDAAIARAEQMRDAKLKSIEKQIAKLKALDFSQIDGA